MNLILGLASTIFFIGCSVKQAVVLTNPPQIKINQNKALTAEGEFNISEKPSIFLWPIDRNGVALSRDEQIQERAKIIKLSDERDEKINLKAEYEQVCAADESKCTDEIIEKTITLSEDIERLTIDLAKQIDETFPVEKNFLTSTTDDIYRIVISNGCVKEIRLVGFQKTNSLTMFTDTKSDSRFRVYEIKYDNEKKLLTFKVPWLHLPWRPKNENNQFNESDEEYLKTISRLGTYQFNLEYTETSTGIKRFAGEVIQVDLYGYQRVGRVTLDGSLEGLK